MKKSMNTSKDIKNNLIAKEIEKLKSIVLTFEKFSKRYSVIRFIAFLSALILFLSFYLNNYKTTAIKKL